MFKKVFSTIIVFSFIFFFYNNCFAQEYNGYVKGELVSVKSELVTKFKDNGYGSNFYFMYYNADTKIVSLVMHGLENGNVMDDISPKTAVNSIMQKNKDKIQEVKKIDIYCCYSKQHKNFYSKKWQCDVNFPVNSSEKLIVYSGKSLFKYGEYIEEEE